MISLKINNFKKWRIKTSLITTIIFKRKLRWLRLGYDPSQRLIRQKSNQKCWWHKFLKMMEAVFGRLIIKRQWKNLMNPLQKWIFKLTLSKWLADLTFRRNLKILKNRVKHHTLENWKLRSFLKNKFLSSKNQLKRAKLLLIMISKRKFINHKAR